MKNKITLFLLFFAIANLFSQQTRLRGNFIMLTVDNNNSNFILYGRNNKNDKWTPLLFEDFPPTSFFRFSKDGKMIPFGEGGSDRYSEIKSDKNSIYYFWKNKEIQMDIKFTLFSSDSSNPIDSLLIELTIKSLEEQPAIIDFFLALDTYLGEKENTHFITDSKKIYNSENEINKKDLPKYIQSYSKDKGIGLNIVFDKISPLPDRIFFANWKLIKDHIGKYKVNKGNSFDLKPFSLNDSAIFLEYEKQKITTKDKKYIFVLSMKNNVKLEDLYETTTTTTTTIQTTTTTINTLTTTTTIERVTNIDNNKELDLINMNLSDLLKLLDDINKKIESGQTLTQQDIDFSNAVLEEIKKRRKK